MQGWRLHVFVEVVPLKCNCSHGSNAAATLGRMHVCSRRLGRGAPCPGYAWERRLGVWPMRYRRADAPPRADVSFRSTGPWEAAGVQKGHRVGAASRLRDLCWWLAASRASGRSRRSRRSKAPRSSGSSHARRLPFCDWTGAVAAPSEDILPSASYPPSPRLRAVPPRDRAAALALCEAPEGCRSHGYHPIPIERLKLMGSRNRRRPNRRLAAPAVATGAAPFLPRRLPTPQQAPGPRRAAAAFLVA